MKLALSLVVYGFHGSRCIGVSELGDVYLVHVPSFGSRHAEHWFLG
jgi:hypothetical protein